VKKKGKLDAPLGPVRKRLPHGPKRRSTGGWESRKRKGFSGHSRSLNERRRGNNLKKRGEIKGKRHFKRTRKALENMVRSIEPTTTGHISQKNRTSRAEKIPGREWTAREKTRGNGHV